MTDIEVGAPEFLTPTVSLGNTSYTSYDKYAAINGIAKCINGDTNVGTTMGANNCQPETLYSPSAVIGGISENLIKNSNYVKKISFLVDGNSKSSYENGAMTSNSQTGDNVTSLSWGSHTLTATFEFDGKSVTSAPKTHHITGLPYTAAPPTSADWSSNQQDILNYVNWENDHVYMEGISIKQTITSPSFHVPAEVNVKLNISADLYAVAVLHIWAQPILACSIGGTQVLYQQGEKGSVNWAGSGNKTTSYDGEATGSLNPSANTIIVENQYTMSSAYIKVYIVGLEYR